MHAPKCAHKRCPPARAFCRSIFSRVITQDIARAFSVSVIVSECICLSICLSLDCDVRAHLKASLGVSAASTCHGTHTRGSPGHIDAALTLRAAVIGGLRDRWMC